MKRHETSFATGGDLIIIEALLTGPRQTLPGFFVLDTGAMFTTMTPELADLLGYSARDGIKRARVHTAIEAKKATSCAWPSSKPSGSRYRAARSTCSTSATRISTGSSG